VEAEKSAIDPAWHLKSLKAHESHICEFLPAKKPFRNGGLVGYDY